MLGTVLGSVVIGMRSLCSQSGKILEFKVMTVEQCAELCRA